VSLEPEAVHQVVHPVEAAQCSALAASGRSDERGDGAATDFDRDVAYRLELAVMQFRDIAIDQSIALLGFSVCIDYCR
jgi:hypothetical protein